MRNLQIAVTFSAAVSGREVLFPEVAQGEERMPATRSGPEGGWHDPRGSRPPGPSAIMPECAFLVMGPSCMSIGLLICPTPLVQHFGVMLHRA